VRKLVAIATLGSTGGDRGKGLRIGSHMLGTAVLYMQNIKAKAIRGKSEGPHSVPSLRCFSRKIQSS